jgi:uncharacterized membrane protein
MRPKATLPPGPRPRLALDARPFAGGVLAGWALFNVVEGTIDHVVLGLHHVREGPDAGLYDAAFVIVSAAVFVGASAMLRRAVGAGDPEAAGSAPGAE